jgi:acetylornithine deacetylase/succinyl-diaminopimelate desuccinylase-like protein
MRMMKAKDKQAAGNSGDPGWEKLSAETLALLKELVVIPAPCGGEEKRAAFCLEYLRKHGVKDAVTDKARNVLVPVHVTASNRLTVFAAHSDVVFPDTEKLPLREENGRIFCPGIGDNSANAAVLMTAAEAFVKSGHCPKEDGLLFVINSGEEGLGNLKGARRILKDYGSRIRRFISFDSTSEEIVDDAVGSERYEISVRTEGGHSYRDFGKKSAIAAAAELIEEACRVKLPKKGRTTYNFGTISGGTSVNSIAQEVKMLFEFRSDRSGSLQKMKKRFNKVFESMQSDEMKISVRSLGERPCAEGVDPEKEMELVKTAAAAVRECYNEKPYTASGSTDCNVFLAAGIPSVCLGACRGKGAHTREEYIEADSLLPGIRLARKLTEEFGK